MQNIIPLDFIDVSRMAATLVTKYAIHFRDDTRRQDFPGSPHHDTQTILLRGPEGKVSRETWQADVPHEDTDLLTAWRSAREVVGLIAQSHQRRAGFEPLFGKIMVVSLKPGGYVDWHTDEGAYAAAHDRFHLCLLGAPGAWIYSGGEGTILPPGQLTWFNNRVIHSAINGLAVARVHLVVDIRKPTEKPN